MTTAFSRNQETLRITLKNYVCPYSDYLDVFIGSHALYIRQYDLKVTNDDFSIFIY